MDDDFVTYLHGDGSSSCLSLRERGTRPGDWMFVVHTLDDLMRSLLGADLVAVARLRGQDRWLFIRADGTTTDPDGPWLGWLLDLAREHGWKP